MSNFKKTLLSLTAVMCTISMAGCGSSDDSDIPTPRRNGESVIADSSSKADSSDAEDSAESEVHEAERNEDNRSEEEIILPDEASMQATAQLLCDWMNCRISNDAEGAEKLLPPEEYRVNFFGDYDPFNSLEDFPSYQITMFSAMEVAREQYEDYPDYNCTESVVQLDFAISLYDENGKRYGDTCTDLAVLIDEEWYILPDCSIIESDIGENGFEYTKELVGIDSVCSQSDGYSYYILDNDEEIPRDEYNPSDYIEVLAVTYGYYLDTSGGKVECVPIDDNGIAVLSDGTTLKISGSKAEIQ